MPCNFAFSKDNRTNVMEAIGNWGFSNKISSYGQELRRLKYIASKMDCLKTRKPMMCVKYNYNYDPEAWRVKPSPEICKPVWTFPINRPLITYSSTADMILTSNLNSIGSDLIHIIPGRSYVLQGTNKWYQRGPEYISQLSQLAPQCPKACCY